MSITVPTQEILAAVVALRRVVRTARDRARVERLARIERNLRAALGPSVPKLAAARALGVSLTALDRWIDRGLVPVVRSRSHSRLRPETWPLVELLEEVERQREQGRTGRLVGPALRQIGRRPYGEGRWIVSADLAALPRPNVSAVELRAEAESSTPLERLETVVDLSEALTTLSELGAAAR